MPTTLITGGERNLGCGIARRLLTLGHRVLIAGINENAAKENLPELEKLGEVAFVKTDVREEEQARSAVDTCLDRFGELSGLVCNAGLPRPNGPPIEELSLEEWDNILRINLTHAFLFAKHAVRPLRETNGAIVLISSTRAIMSQPKGFAYSASKAGMLGLTQAMAVDLGPEIRTNAILPGWINVQGKEYSREAHEQHPAGRIGKAEDVAHLTAFLLDREQSGFITGEYFTVDGGMVRKMVYRR